MRWWDYRCKQPATYRPGVCDMPLFKINDEGDIEVKCSSCKRFHIVHHDETDDLRACDEGDEGKGLYVGKG